MISIRSRRFDPPRSICEYQAAKDGRYAWFLCTWHPESDLVLEEIQAEIKLEILNSGVQEISKMEIANWLKTFFADFHWKLHARLRKTGLKEKGISLFFGVIFDRELHFVQFGRLFCAQTEGKKLNFPGRNWKNYHVQTITELNLLGLDEEDIRVKPERISLAEGERFIVLPGSLAGRVFGSEPDLGSLVTLIESYASAQNPLWLILENVSSLSKTRRSRFSKVHISAAILLLLTLAAIAYIGFGNNWFDVIAHKARILFRSRRTTTLEEIPNILKIDNSNIFKYLDKTVNAPARNIELLIMWSTDLPYHITAAPAFNLDTIYLASDNNLLAFNKKNRNLLWKTPLAADIVSILNTEAGVVVALENRQLLGLKDDGSLIWTQDVNAYLSDRSHLQALEITNADNPRIARSITVIPLERGLSVVDSHRGENLCELKLTQKLQYFSDYDRFDSCFYAVVADAILCIELKIIN